MKLSLEKPFDGWTRDLHSELVCTRGLRPDTSNTLHPISSELKVILEQAWSPIPSNRGTMSQIGAQLQCLMSNQMAYIAEQQKLQSKIQELEQQQMSFAAGSSPSGETPNHFYIDNISLCMLNSSSPPTTIPPPAATTISRNLSFESIETIHTRAQSVEDFHYF